MLDRLLETRRTHRKAPLPSPPIAAGAAYRIQDELREALVARGERVIGWKAGLTGWVALDQRTDPGGASGTLSRRVLPCPGGPRSRVPVESSVSSPRLNLRRP
jgi:2-keto-4-pentenoate hydratase